MKLKMDRIRFWYFISVISVFLFPSVLSGAEKTTFRTLGFADGLPHSDINDIVQDKRGYMWFATYGGLCKWDGYRMEVFTSRNSSLSKERVLCLCAASDSLLYIGTEAGGLNVYDDRSKDFIPVVYDNLPFDDVVSYIFESMDGHVFVCHNNIVSSVAIAEGQAFVKTLFTVPYSSVPISSAVDIDSERMLIGSGNTFYILSLNTGEARVVADSGYKFWNDVAKEHDGNILCASHSGLYRVNPKTLDVSLVFDAVCESVSVSVDGSIWLGTGRDGLYEIESGSGKAIAHYTSESFRNDVLSSSEISSLYCDNSDVLWVGTIGGCINTLDLHHNNISLYTSSEGLSDNRIITFGEDISGHWLWISSHDGGLDVMDQITGTFHNLRINGRPSKEFPIISSFYTDDAGNIWIGTWGEGIWLISRRDVDGISHGDYDISARSLDVASLNGKSVYKILKDSDGYLWISTNQGVVEYVPSKNNYVEYRHSANNYNTLSSDFVTDICVVDSIAGCKTVWIGTRLGLNRAVFMNSSLVRWDRCKLDSRSDDSHFISCIHHDKTGNLWVTSLGGGLYKLEPYSDPMASLEFESIDPDGEDFVTNELESILEDDDGNLWIGGYGIFKYSVCNNTVMRFTDNDNLQSNSFKIWAALKMKNGRLAFGGINGFNTFMPDSIRRNPYVPESSVSAVYINGRPRMSDRNMVLKHNENNVVAEFSSFVYNNPVCNKFRYRLTGYEDVWNEAGGHDPKCIYSNLPAGKYTLEVLGSNNDGVWAQVPFVLKLRIRPHPLSSPAAIVIYILLAMLSAYWMYRIVLSRTNEKNERKAEREKLRFFTDLAHEIKTPLTLIAAPVEELLSSSAIGHSTRTRLQLVDKNVNTLQSLVQQIIDLRKYEDNMMKLTVLEIDMCRFLKEIAELFMPLAESKRINFRTDISDSPQMVYIDKKKIERVVVNLLSNAFKFTPADGEVVLSCYGDGKSVTFSVLDTGVGISETDKDRIFDRFYQGTNSVNVSGGSGIGLSLSRYIIQHHKGEITVESKPMAGTKFSVRLLKGKEHFVSSQINESYSNSDSLSNYDPIVADAGGDVSSACSSGKNVTILVVDDNADLRGYLVNVLKGRYNVLSAENGMKAYETAIAEQPDLVLSDVVMPEMGGIELCRRIKENDATSHIIVVLLTARDLVSTEIESWQTGADGFIIKPFHLDVLFSRIDNLISSRDRLRKVFKSTIDVDPKEVTVVTSDEKFLKKCLDAIEEEISNPDFGVDELCKVIAVSRAQLYRKINSITGLSPIHFIRSIRLKRAAQLLLQDSSSISDVMFSVGFNNASYFSKIFKEEFGCLPKDYRFKREC